MNKKRIEALRDRIAAAPAESCDMNQWRCGGVACIGGWTEIQREKELETDVELSPNLAKYLGLSIKSFISLCYDFPALPPRGMNWKDWMLARLDWLVKEGDV